MDNPRQPEQGYTNPESDEAATNASTLETDEETHEPSIQFPLLDFQNMEDILNESASIYTSDTSADTNDAISTKQQGDDNTFSSVNSQDSQFSSTIEISGDFETSGGSRNHPVSYDMVKVSSVDTHKRKISGTDYTMTTENNPDHKRSKPEISVKSVKDFSTDSEQDLDKDNMLELSATSQVASDNSTLVGIDGQNIESNNSISETAQNENSPSKISDSIACKGESILPMVDNLAIPGTSGFDGNKSTSNLRGEAFQSFTCRVCKIEISQHVTEKNIFKCCICSYTNCEKVNVQIHSYTHVTKTTCNICGKEHAVGNSHVSEQPCTQCGLMFQCRTMLYTHFLHHIEYYRKNCWVCSRTFVDHKTKEDFCYLCCVCGFESKTFCSLEIHNRLHLPRFFCKLCNEEYSREEMDLHDSGFMCFECPITFKCQTQLEKHCEDHHEYSSENCRVCKGTIMDHFIGIGGGKEFQCCNIECSGNFYTKLALLNHIDSHEGLQIPKSLRFCKCNICGKRFSSQRILNGHYRCCKTLPFKCEICEKCFYSSDILQAHHLLNHRQA